MHDYPAEIERFMIPTVIQMESGCWLWTGAVKAAYGEARGKDQKSLRAHRVFYEAYNGPIPDDMCLDHLCSEKLCVNPKHLEVVTRAENNRRTAERLRGRQLGKRTRVLPNKPGDEDKVCVRGHSYIGNRREYRGGTYCAECNNEAARKYMDRKRANRT